MPIWNPWHGCKKISPRYYNSLTVMKEKGYHSISFPLISSGIFGGSLNNPVGESTKQCCRAYKKLVEDYPDYDLEVLLCAFLKMNMIMLKMNLILKVIHERCV